MTKYEPCEVCRGREIITVPIFRSAAAARHQEGLAKEVVEEAAAQIKNWGSQVHFEHIHKSRAVDFVYEALKTVLNRRKVREA